MALSYDHSTCIDISGLCKQCPKLSMHPAPGVHIFRAGCTIFKDVHPDCAHIFSHLSLLNIRRVHGEVPGCTVSRGVHPAGAQSKTDKA